LLVRFGADGIINHCKEFYAQDIQMRDDNDPPKTNLEDIAEFWQETMLRSSEPSDFHSLLPLQTVDLQMEVIELCLDIR
jgi:hypothetical protein